MSTAFVPGQKNIAGIPPIPAIMLRAAEDNKVFIFNVGPKEHIVPQGSLGNRVIPACPEGERVSEPLVVRGLEFETIVKNVDGTRVEYEWVSTEGDKLAANIIGTGPFKDRSEDLTRLGVFLSKRSQPTESEIQDAHDKLNLHYSNIVAEADKSYEINGGMEIVNGKTISNINRDHVEAAAALGIQRPWARRNLSMKMDACWNCGRAVLPTSAKCFHEGCGAPLKDESAKQRFMHPEEVEVKRGPGRPPKDS